MARKGNNKTVSEVRTSETPVELDRADDSLDSTSMGSEPTEEDIRMRAYQKFVERGGGHGSHLEDWVEAERELKRSR
jgi:hypothetical protein